MSWQLLNRFCSLFINLNKCNNFPVLTNMPFYAVAKGRTTGIFMTWADCEAQVKGFSGAKYKKFDSAAAAQEYITAGIGNSKPAPKTNLTHTANSSKLNPIASNSNLKRSYSTSSKKAPQNVKSSRVKPKSEPAREDYGFSDDSDDLNDMLNKQMDDIEKRLKVFEKGLDKILKKNTVKSKKTMLIEPPQPKRTKQEGSNEFEVDSNGFVQVYTDGACSANGQKGARAGFGVFWGDGHPLNRSEPVNGRATNNCGEIQAASCAIKVALDNGVDKLSINTDSKFVINAITKWIPVWKRKGWKLKSGEPVKNELDFIELESLHNQLTVKWNYVEAHRGIHGNEMADQLAKAGAARYNN